MAKHHRALKKEYQALLGEKNHARPALAKKLSVTLCKVQTTLEALGHLSMDLAKPEAMQGKSRGACKETRERKEVNSCAG